MIQNIFFSIQNNFIVQQSELGVLIFFNHVWKYQCHYKLFIVFIKGCPRGETCEVGTKIKTFLFFCYFLNLGGMWDDSKFSKTGGVRYDPNSVLCSRQCYTISVCYEGVIYEQNSAVITQQQQCSHYATAQNTCRFRQLYFRNTFCEYWNLK